jgi:hypothetical protein
VFLHRVLRWFARSFQWSRNGRPIGLSPNAQTEHRSKFIPSGVRHRAGIDFARPSAKRSGCDIVTDCPTLLAIPAIQKRVGFGEIERLDLSGATSFPESTAEFFPASRASHPEMGSGLTA